MVCVSMISLCILVLGFVQLTVAVKLVPLQAYHRKHFWWKPQTHVFSQPLKLITRTPKFGPSRTPQAQYMALIYDNLRSTCFFVVNIIYRFSSDLNNLYYLACFLGSMKVGSSGMIVFCNFPLFIYSFS